MEGDLQGETRLYEQGDLSAKMQYQAGEKDGPYELFSPMGS